MYCHCGSQLKHSICSRCAMHKQKIASNSQIAYCLATTVEGFAQERRPHLNAQASPFCSLPAQKPALVLPGHGQPRLEDNALMYIYSFALY